MNVTKYPCLAIYSRFSENSTGLLAIEKKKIKIFENKPVCLVLSILMINKTVLYEFWYDYVKRLIKSKLCYINADSFIVYTKTDGIYVDIGKDVGTRFDT